MMGTKEKKERALGVRLGLKGDRAMSPKSSVVRKPYRPGVHGPRSRPKSLSEFGLQIREKNKFKLSYGVDDRNLKRLFKMAQVAKGATGAKMLEFLEGRLDNIVFLLGFAVSRGAARQLVSHGHIMVNKKKVTSPGYQTKKGEIVAVKLGSMTNSAFEKRKDFLKKYDPPSWLRLDAEKMEGEILGPPSDANQPFEINLLVESFSK